MAKIANPWFDDLPASFKTDDRKYIIVSSAAQHTATTIISNGFPVTRLTELQRDLRDLHERYRNEEKDVELVFAQCWASKKRHQSTMSQLMDTVKRARKGREKQKTLFQHISFLQEVIWYLEDHLELPLSRSLGHPFVPSGGLHREELTV